MRTIFTAPVLTLAAALSLGILGASTAAAAEITTSNDASSEDTSYAGTSNAAVDHMAGVTNDGNLEGDSPKTVLKAFHYPLFNEDGTPKVDDEGNQLYGTEWRSVPIGGGVADAKIVKQY